MIYLLRPWAILLQMSPIFLANPGFFHANYASFYPISREDCLCIEKPSSGRMTISRKNGPSPCSRVFLVGANVVLSCWPSNSDPVEHEEPSRSAGMTLPPRTRQSNIKGILLIQGRLEVFLLLLPCCWLLPASRRRRLMMAEYVITTTNQQLLRTILLFFEIVAQAF